MLAYLRQNADEVILVRSAFQRSGIEHTFITVSDGLQALEYFQRVGEYADRKRFPLPSSGH